MPVLTHLTRLSSLIVDIATGRVADEMVRSHAMRLPNLKSLHMRGIKFNDLTLECTVLRSLCLQYCHVKGNLNLQAPLKELSYTGDGLCMAYVFPLSNMHRLTRLHCHHHDTHGTEEDIFSVLPLMSGLRSLDFISYTGSFPHSLPNSLWEVRVVLYFDWFWYSKNQLQYFEDACQLPELQRIDLWKCSKWQPSESQQLLRIKSTSKAMVTVREGVEHKEIFPKLSRTEPFPYAAAGLASGHRLKTFCKIGVAGGSNNAGSTNCSQGRGLDGLACPTVGHTKTCMR